MKTYHVVAAIIEREGAVLATERGYGEYKDWWEFPGGKVEPGETPEEALVREIAEELDVAVEVRRHVCDVSWDYPEFHLEMACFLCAISEGEPRLLEHEDARWLGAAELGDVRWLPADVAVVEALRQQGVV